MNTFFLDFGSHHAALACIKDDAVVGWHSFTERPQEAALFAQIREMTDACPPDRIAAVTGPGGFMSLRTGISIANAMAWSRHIPIAGVPLPALWEARLEQGQGALWLHSTKKDLLFVKSVGVDTSIPDIVLKSPEEVASEVKDAPWIGELIPSHAEMLHGMAPLSPVKDALPKLLSSLTYGETSLLPWYGRGI